MPHLNDLTPLLRTRDLAETIRFYTEVLEFILHDTYPDEKPTWCMLDHGNIHLMFYEDPDPTPTAMTGRLYLYTDDVLAVYARVKEKARILDEPEIYAYGMHEFCFEDPNGYHLAVGQQNDAEPTCTDS